MTASSAAGMPSLASSPRRSGRASALRRATSAAHEAAEAAIGDVRRRDPGELLVALERFHEPMEAALAPWVERDGVPRELQRGWRRAGLLRAGLAACGRRPWRGGGTVPELDADTAVGAWYVLEGSRLGGRVLAAELAAAAPVPAAVLRALGVDGDVLRWPRFTRWLDEGCAADHDAAAAGAHAAYAAFVAMTAR